MFSYIRKAKPGDGQAIADIYNHYLGKATMDLQLKDGTYYQQIMNSQDEMEELWVLDQGMIKSWGIIKKYSDREGYRLTGETSVYVHPDHLRQKYGTNLKLHLMTRCKALGYHHLLARIFTENEVSINYNIKLGYTIVGVQKEIGNIHGKWKDVTVMQCLL